MNSTVKPLTPALAEDYAHFFDTTPHNDNTGENTCYCVTWRSDDTYAGDGDHWFATRAERRDRAMQYVRAGSLQGYLAYQGGTVVGWCNANAGCRLCVDYLRSFWPIEAHRADIRVKSVFCFVIAPAVRRTGVATQLLARVCQDAAADGFDFVEAYVDMNLDDEPSCFRGPLAMYEKAGFVRCGERDGRIVMRKALGA